MRNLGEAKAEAAQGSARHGTVGRVYRVLDGPSRGGYWVRFEKENRTEVGGARVACVAAFRGGREVPLSDPSEVVVVGPPSGLVRVSRGLGGRVRR